MEAKHTPGPWDIVTAPHGMFVMGGTYTIHKVGPSTRDQADACLIAAAPDMLAALVDARAKVASAAASDACKWTIDLLKITEHVTQQCAGIDAAIAKATPKPKK